MKVSRSKLPLSLFLVAAWAVQRSDGCSCPQWALTVRPSWKELAPLNGHVWITIPPGRMFEGPGEPVAARSVRSELRDPSGQVVPTKRLASRSGYFLIVELIPDHDLRPNTSYDVVVTVPPGLDPESQIEFVMKVNTGDERATSPPAWAGIPIARYLQVHGGGTDCSTRDPTIVMEDGRHFPPDFEKHPPLYAIWRGRHPGDIDYTKRPDNYAYPLLELGHWSICRSSNFIFEPGPLRLGIRLVDLAGNYNAKIVEVQFDDIPSSCTAPLPEHAEIVDLKGTIIEPGREPTPPPPKPMRWRWPY